MKRRTGAEAGVGRRRGGLRSCSRGQGSRVPGVRAVLRAAGTGIRRVMRQRWNSFTGVEGPTAVRRLLVPLPADHLDESGADEVLKRPAQLLNGQSGRGFEGAHF